MGNTDQTAEDLKIWNSEEKRVERRRLLSELAMGADIYKEFNQLPPLRVMNWDPDKFWINVLAMAKIREMHNIAEKPVMP